MSCVSRSHTDVGPAARSLRRYGRRALSRLALPAAYLFSVTFRIEAIWGVNSSCRPTGHSNKAGRSHSPPPQSLFLFNAVDGKNAESRVFAVHLLLKVAAAAIPPLLQAVHVLVLYQYDAIGWRGFSKGATPHTACGSLVVT